MITVDTPLQEKKNEVLKRMDELVDLVEEFADLPDENPPLAKQTAYYLQKLMRNRYNLFTEGERIILEAAYEVVERAENREDRCAELRPG